MAYQWKPVAEDAATIRKALKAAYPTIRFSVRSQNYSGGSSITVEWLEGPSSKNVEDLAWQVALQFSGDHRYFHARRLTVEEVARQAVYMHMTTQERAAALAG